MVPSQHGIPLLVLPDGVYKDAFHCLQLLSIFTSLPTLQSEASSKLPSFYSLPDHPSPKPIGNPHQPPIMSAPVSSVPKTCCGRSGGSCACAAEATCSCGKKSAGACDCEKAATENVVSGASCSCGTSLLPADSVTVKVANMRQANELLVNALAHDQQLKTLCLESPVLVESVRKVSLVYAVGAHPTVLARLTIRRCVHL